MAGKVVGFGVGLVVSLLLVPADGPGVPAHARLRGRSASLAGYIAPNMYLYQQGYDRTEQMQRALPDAIDLLTISVESGLGFDAACRPGGAQHRRARWPRSSPACCRRCRSVSAAPRRCARSASAPTCPTCAPSSAPMVQADAFGIPVGQVLRVQSSEIRVKRRQRAEEQAQKVPVKILVPLIFCILPVPVHRGARSGGYPRSWTASRAHSERDRRRSGRPRGPSVHRRGPHLARRGGWARSTSTARCSSSLTAARRRGAWP